MLGLVPRAAVKLDDHVGDELAIGEGVETCLAARMLGIRPTWALGSVGMITHFPLLPGIRTLRLIGEADAASDRAIALCGERWQRADAACASQAGPQLQRPQRRPGSARL